MRSESSQNFGCLSYAAVPGAAALRCRVAVCGDIVDFLLPFFHAGNVVFQRHGLRRRIRYGEAKRSSLAIASWLAKSSAGPSFSTQPNCCQKVWYFFRSSFASFPAFAATLGQRIAQVTRYRAVLDDFTGNVQRQIAGVNQTTHEAQIVRHELFCVVHDEHAEHTVSDRVYDRGSTHIPRYLRRNVQQAGDSAYLPTRFVAPGQRIVKVVGDVFVNSLYSSSVISDLLRSPQRLRFVDYSQGDNGFAVFLFAFFDLTGSAIWSEYLLMMERTLPVIEGNSSSPSRTDAG